MLEAIPGKPIASVSVLNSPDSKENLDRLLRSEADLALAARSGVWERGNPPASKSKSCSSFNLKPFASDLGVSQHPCGANPQGLPDP